MTSSTFEQPLPDDWMPRAAHAHNRDGLAQPAPWHVYPEQRAAVRLRDQKRQERRGRRRRASPLATRSHR
jgi:hypothetical protein